MWPIAIVVAWSVCVSVITTVSPAKMAEPNLGMDGYPIRLSGFPLSIWNLSPVGLHVARRIGFLRLTVPCHSCDVTAQLLPCELCSARYCCRPAGRRPPPAGRPVFATRCAWAILLISFRSSAWKRGRRLELLTTTTIRLSHLEATDGGTVVCNKCLRT